MDETMKEVDGRHTTATWWSEAVSITIDRQMAPVSEEARSRDVQLYVVIGFLSLMSVVGTAGNALVLCVFFKKREEMAVSTLLIIVLAVVDFVTCLIVIPYTIYMESVDFRLQSDISCKTYQFLITSNIPFSALIMVLIALDRYLCICHPFLRLLTVARAKCVTAALAFFAAALGLCVSLMFGVYQRRSETSSATAELDGHPTDMVTPPTPVGFWTRNYGSLGKLGGLALGTSTMPVSIWADQKQSRDGFSQSSVGQFGSTSQPSPLNFAAEGPASKRLEVHSSNETTPLRFYGDVGRKHFLENVPTGNWISLIETTDGSGPVVESSWTDDGLGQLENAGHCESNDLLISADFQYYYQKLYTAMYPVCLGIVITLYVLIYRSVLERRTRREMQKSKTIDVVRSLNSAPTRYRVEPDNSYRTETLPGNADANHEAEIEPIIKRETGSSEKRRRSGSQTNRMSKVDSNRLANLKTAAMLFVVTVVFVVTFLPAFLMVLQLVPNNVIVFYLYFANNVANPVIYSFMNRNFRNNLLKLFKNRP